MELDRFNNFLNEKKKGKSKKKDKKEKKNDFISKKISKLIDEGYPHNQAVAIAMSYADKKGLLESNSSEDTTININKKLLVDIIYKFFMIDKNIEKKVLDKFDKDNSIDTKDKVYPFLQSLDTNVLENIILDITT